MKHIYVCWKAIYKYKTHLCNCKCAASQLQIANRYYTKYNTGQCISEDCTCASNVYCPYQYVC